MHHDTIVNVPSCGDCVLSCPVDMTVALEKVAWNMTGRLLRQFVVVVPLVHVTTSQEEEDGSKG